MREAHSEQIWRRPVTYHPERIEDKSTAQNPDFRLVLPRAIHKLNLWHGDDVDIQFVEDPPHLIGVKADEPSDTTQQIYRNAPLRITLSSDWLDHLLEHGGDETLVVEVNSVDQEFRVYRNRNFRDHRIPELEERGQDPLYGRPIIVPAGAAPRIGRKGELGAYRRVNHSLREKFGDDIDDTPVDN